MVVLSIEKGPCFFYPFLVHFKVCFVSGKNFDSSINRPKNIQSIFVVYRHAYGIVLESQEPEETDFINTNSSCINLQLSLWNNGGCPISHFSIEHRPHGKLWTFVFFLFDVRLEFITYRNSSSVQISKATKKSSYFFCHEKPYACWLNCFFTAPKCQFIFDNTLLYCESLFNFLIKVKYNGLSYRRTSLMSMRIEGI